MKKYLPLILLVAVLLVAGWLLVRNSGPSRYFNNEITLLEEDDIPYGTAVARSMMPRFFPEARVLRDIKPAGQWDSLELSEGGQGLVCIGKELNYSEDEVEELLSFASHGNYVLLVGKDFSSSLGRALHIETTDGSSYSDSMIVTLDAPRFQAQTFHYPGYDFSSDIVRVVPDSSVVLGSLVKGHPNFIQVRTGRGAIFVLSSPLTFSNYFLLQPGNEKYLASVFSLMPSDLHRVVWNENALMTPKSREEEPSWLGVLLRYPPFAWALGLTAGLLILYALSEMRRRQRAIPVYALPQNDSLDFVKTVGRLYYDRRDHFDLARKMVVYFLEHVRQQYKISTANLDDEFVQRLQARSGYGAEALSALVRQINRMRNEGTISADGLVSLHHRLENFYRHG